MRRITIKLLCSYLSILTLSFNVSAKVIIVEDVDHLRSIDYNYPKNNETLDVIWLFDHSIRLKLNEFHLNGHGGDFVLVSEMPLLDTEYIKERISAGASDEELYGLLADAILSDQGLLLSWKVNKTIEAINSRGTFVLFHTEAKEPAWTAEFKGFDIQVVNYDDAITTTTSTTPDPYVPPREGQEIYITKYLDCKKPLEFLRDLDDFKTKVAQLATRYCQESKVPNCLDRGAITKEDVNVPGPNENKYAGLHYCDTTWPKYSTCVEVTFAIIRTDNNGNYVLPKEQLDIMWTSKSQSLEQHGYCPYDPPKEKLDLNTVVWIAFFLGIILSLTAILGFVRIKNSRVLTHYRNSFTKGAEEEEKERRGVIKGIRKLPDETKIQHKHFDEKNPIFKIIPRSQMRKEPLYPSNDYLNPEDEEEVSSAGLFNNHSTDNPTFQNAEVDVYAYENDGYEQEEDAEEEEEDEQEENASPTKNLNNRDKLIMRSKLHRASDSEI